MDNAFCGGGDPGAGISSTAIPISASAQNMVKAAIFMGDPRAQYGLAYQVGTCRAGGVSISRYLIPHSPVFECGHAGQRYMYIYIYINIDTIRPIYSLTPARPASSVPTRPRCSRTATRPTRTAATATTPTTTSSTAPSTAPTPCPSSGAGSTLTAGIPAAAAAATAGAT